MANALNIVGENHKEYVSNQITTRQRVLNQRREAISDNEAGYQYRDSSNLSYINSRTSYLRIASSVDVRESNVYKSVLTSEERVDDGGYELRKRLYGLTPEGTIVGGGLNSLGSTYNYLAANLILYGGTSKSRTDRMTSFTSFRWAIDTLGASSRAIDTTFLNEGSNNFYDLDVVSVDTSPHDPYNYGYGGSEFGLVPAPGIVSFVTSNVNKGELKISTIELRANNKRQFEWIEALYLRLGYTVFVEWGDSSYYKTDKENDDVKYITGVDAFNSLLRKFLWNDLEEPGNPTIGEYEQRIEDFWNGIYNSYNYREESETDYHNLNLFYKAIEKLREESEGNYDALLGRVRNFNWEFTTEGYYKITIELVSYGDIVESLKINNFTYSTDLDKFYPTQRSSVNSDLEAFIMTAADFYPFVTNTLDPSNTWYYSDSYKNYPSLKNPGEPIEQREVVDRLAGYTRPKREWGKVIAMQAHVDDSPYFNQSPPPQNATPEEYEEWKYENMHSNAKVYQYVRLKDILDFINERCLLYGSDNKKIVRIEVPDETLDENGNPKEQCIGYSNGYQVSADPTQLVVRSDLGFVKFLYTPSGSESTGAVTGSAYVNAFTGKYVSIDPTTNNGAEFFHAVDSNNERYCNILNIYYSTEYLFQQFPTGDSEGELYLYDFIENLLTTANRCLGGVNRFTCRLSEDNILQIYDESRPSATKNFIKNPESATLNLYGLKNYSKLTENPEDPNKPFKTLYTEGSFVRNFSISSQLDKSFSTLISVGAQANGFAVGEDATMFSKWNKGLHDRIVPSKLDWSGNYTSVREQRIKTYKDAVTKYYYFLEHYSTDWSVSQNLGDGIQILWCPSNYAANVKTQKDIFKWYSSIASMTSPESEVDYINPTIGFLPINLSIDMDGISGMRVFDKLTVQTDFLPPGYDDTLDFIIKTIEHRIGLDNRWITHLETFSVPKLKNKEQSPGYFSAETLAAALTAPLGLGFLAPSSVQQTNNNFGTSYFRIDETTLPLVQMLGTGNKYSLNPNDNSLDDLVKVVNDSAAPYFKKFFENILKDPKTKDGYVFQINSAYRPLGNNAKATPNARSSHMFGLAVDMAVYELGNNGSTRLYASNESISSTNYARRYQDLNIVENAKKEGIGWAGLRSGYFIGPNRDQRDNVHFAIDGMDARYVYYASGSDIISSTGGGWGGNAAEKNLLPDLNNYLKDHVDTTFLQNEYGPVGLSTNPSDYTWSKISSNVASRYTRLSDAQEEEAQIYYNRLNTKNYFRVEVLRTYYDANATDGIYWKDLPAGQFSLHFAPLYANLSISIDPSTFERDSDGKLTRNNYIPKYNFNSLFPTQINNPLGIPGL